ncbi:hypothetical protein BDY19DRAFT_974748 [Irpex rosettiformis]|uniref:Uncharacterized protein n=1 Tax=Irpex rosettiformis TaxID=378272 RepID=A0ACB8TPH3_9APHY|nr:hypothetical protein BDY19DRAFT_974748 [Irpex rosettiformis]
MGLAASTTSHDKSTGDFDESISPTNEVLEVSERRLTVRDTTGILIFRLFVSVPLVIAQYTPVRKVS